MSAFSRHECIRVSAITCPSRNQRAQGMPGARCTRGLIRKWRRGAHEHTGSAEAPGIPCAAALRLMPCSPRRRIRLVTVVGGFWRSFKPGRAWTDHRRLGTSNGCQDHTVLPYARNVVRPARLAIAHEDQPALRPRLRADALASTTSRTTFVTIAIRPSCRNGTNDLKPLIWGRCEAQSCPSCHCAAALSFVVIPGRA